MYPAVPTQFRKTLRDTVVPLAKAVRGVDGRTMQEVTLNKGTSIFIRGFSFFRAKSSD